MKNKLLFLTAMIICIAFSSRASIITEDTIYRCIPSLSVVDLRHYQTNPDIIYNNWKSIDGETLVDKHLYTPNKKGFFRFELTHIYIGSGLPSISKDTLTVGVNQEKTLVISVEGQPSNCIGVADKLFYADSVLLKKPLVWSNGDTAFHTHMFDANYTVQTQKEDEQMCLVFPIVLPVAKVHCNANEVEELKEKDLFEVFPNPTNGIITIKARENADLYEKIVVKDVLGNVVREFSTAAEKSLKIDLSSLMHGCYFISDSKGNFIKKVVLH